MLYVVPSTNTSQIEYHSTSDASWYLHQAVNSRGSPAFSPFVIEGQGSAFFRFTGSLVDVFGIETFTGSGLEAISLYTLDQQAPVMHISSTSQMVPVVLKSFYTSGNISYGDHVLIINVTQASMWEPYYLDHISYINNGIPSVSSSSTSSTNTATSTMDAGLPTISTTSVVEKSNNVNVIVGGVVGGAVGLIAIILAIFFFCFGRPVLQRYTARRRDTQSELPTEATDVTPYIASDVGSSPQMSEAQSGERPSLYPHEATRSSFTLAPEDSASQAGLGALMNSPPGSRWSASRKSGVPPPAAYESSPMRHADSGLRSRPEATSSEVAPAEIPPVYTPS